ncbi:LiaF transmembrane domain-containing protein [Sphingobacterium sp. MYb382]|uniref:LiaF transmembrane domain-containing protein n=1 Tax=Sphingobacterium sp. MYb382 TaxID=2745278 RepID=UPI0030AB2A73
MEREYNTTPPVKPPKNSKSATIVGFVIVFFGVSLLMKSLDLGYWFPRWVFGWEMILIIIGLVIGVNSRFEKKSSIILISIGGLFLLKNIFFLPFGKVILPIGAIIIGLFLIMRNRSQSTPPFTPPTPPPTPAPTDRPPHDAGEFDWDKRVVNDEAEETPFQSPFQQQAEPNQQDYQQQQQQTPPQFNLHGENYIKVDSIFGNAKKRVFTKNFLGGNVTNVFGSTEINFLQADIQQPVALDVFQLFGSTKIIVPPHWVIATSVSSILGENDDRRVILAYAVDQNKCLYITGTSILGNITIKNS